MIKKRLFGNTDCKEVFAYELINDKGTLSAEIITYGGIVRTLKYKGVDVVLGRDTMEEYENNKGYYGALVGRNSNRIFGGKFVLNGKEYSLEKNDNGICNLHGGVKGYSHSVWNAKEIDGNEPSLVLSLFDPDGNEGFPGNVNVTVTYTVTNDNQLKIHYEAESDADTVINLTNHSYFNLNGHASGSAQNHTLTIAASFYTPNTKDCYPYGEILSVENTPFDFRKGKVLKDGFAADFEQIKMFGGYDHNFVLDGTGYRKYAVAKGDVSGIIMECYTDLPGVQLYTGNGIENERVCKDGAVYDTHQAFCLETQKFPNATNLPFFPSIFVKKGEKYNTVSAYKFI
ncbi:MAG: galactose mutarotase [Oscillospiraceae bacterium]|nr:galactose mutarotase [Oscillospiraceae bacterium]